jgi:hypothetical protein
VLTPVTLAVTAVNLCVRDEKRRREHGSYTGYMASAKSEETTVSGFVHERKLERITCHTRYMAYVKYGVATTTGCVY